MSENSVRRVGRFIVFDTEYPTWINSEQIVAIEENKVEKMVKCGDGYGFEMRTIIDGFSISLSNGKEISFGNEFEADFWNVMESFDNDETISVYIDNFDELSGSVDVSFREALDVCQH